MYKPLQYLLDKYPDKFKNVSTDTIIKNPNITHETIKNILKTDQSNIIKSYYYICHCVLPKCIDNRHYWYRNFKQKHSLDIIKILPNYDWRVYLYSSFVKENIDKYPIKHFLSMNMLYGNIDDILYILRKYPNSGWRMYTLSMNLKITMKIIKDNMDIKWDWQCLSLNPSITMGDIEDNLDIPWDLKYLLFNPNISIEMLGLIQYKSNLTLFEHYIIYDKSLKIKPEIINYIIDNYDMNDSSYYWISLHITIETLKKYPKKKWSWSELSISYNITLKDIENNIDLPWPFCYMSSNPNLTIEFVKKYSNKRWDWECVSSNPNITMKDIENNSNLPWNFNYISDNPNLTIDFIEKNIDESFNWNRIARNHFITDIRTNAINKICNRWKVRNNRYKMEHKYRLKCVKAELETMHPSKTDNFDFKGGIAYIEALGHFNSIKN